MLNSAIYLFIDIFSAVIPISIMNKYFKKKYTGLSGAVASLIGMFGYFLLMRYYNKLLLSEGLLGIGYSVILMLYGYVCLKGKFREIVAISILWILISMLCSYLLWGIVKIITPGELGNIAQPENMTIMYVSCAAIILKIILGRCIVSIKKRREGLERSEDWVVTLSLFMIFILVVGIFSLELGTFSGVGRVYLSICLMGGTAGLVGCQSYLYHRMDEYHRKIQEEAYNQERYKRQEEHIKSLGRMCQGIHMLKHDMTGQLDMLYRLVKTGKTEAALGYIENINKGTEGLEILSKTTGNDGIDTALMKTIQECEEHGITFSYLILGHVERMDKMDMAILFYNLLSNAVEACHYANQKEIRLQISESKDEKKMEVVLENTIERSVLETNPHLLTSKKEKSKHGFGMISIQERIEKYQGIYSCHEENNLFIQEIVLEYVCARREGYEL